MDGFKFFNQTSINLAKLRPLGNVDFTAAIKGIYIENS